MSMQKTLLTADEFYDFCCQNEGRYELERGIIVEKDGPAKPKTRTALNIASAMFLFVHHNSLGRVRVETGYYIETNPDSQRDPDVTFLTDARVLGEDNGTLTYPAPPDIAVQIVSASSVSAEMEPKVYEYLAAGSQRVWVVYPATPSASRRVVVHHPDGTAITYTGDDVITDEELLPGFSLPLAEIFE